MSNQPLTVAAGIAASAVAGAVASTIGLEVPATLLVVAGVTAIDAISNRKATPEATSNLAFYRKYLQLKDRVQSYPQRSEQDLSEGAMLSEVFGLNQLPEGNTFVLCRRRLEAIKQEFEPSPNLEAAALSHSPDRSTQMSSASTESAEAFEFSPSNQPQSPVKPVPTKTPRRKSSTKPVS